MRKWTMILVPVPKFQHLDMLLGCTTMASHPVVRLAQRKIDYQP